MVDKKARIFYNDYNADSGRATEYAGAALSAGRKDNMLNFMLDHELFINGVSRILYDDVWNCVKLDPRFDFDDFDVRFDMDVIKWVDEEECDCIVDKVNVRAWVFNGHLIKVDTCVYGHDVDYGELDPDFCKEIDCNREIEKHILFEMVSEIVKKAAGIAAYEVTQGITYDWSLDGF